MHEVDQTTEQMVRSVLAYAENRLRMNPVPLDKGTLSADELYERLDGVIRDTPRPPDEVSTFVVFLASDESRYATGAEFVIDGGLVNDVPHKV